MSRVLIALAAVASVGFGASPPKEKRSPSIGVYLDFDSQPGELSVEAMKKEVDAIMRPTGLSLNWRSTHENKGTEPFSGLVVVRFRGKCRIEPWNEDLAPLSAGEITLATTTVSGGRVLPFSEVECDQVRKSVPYLQEGVSTQQKQFALGLAMGRVVAHELYHVLASTTAHARKGLAKASQTWRDFVTGTLTFGDSESRAMRRGINVGNRAAFRSGE